jgi:hypothetical protein
MSQVQPYGAADLWQLPDRLRTLVEAELESGETVSWYGRPIRRRFTVESLPAVAFGIPWTAFALFWTAGAAGFKVPNFPPRQPFDFFPLFGVPFILIGFGMLCTPLWMARKAQQTVYVLTDRRAIIFDGAGRSTNIRSFWPEKLGNLQRKQFRNGSGDLIFDRSLAGNKASGERFTNVGFLSIANVQEVERMTRRLAEAKSQRED